jgi:hypothetical protein
MSRGAAQVDQWCDGLDDLGTETRDRECGGDVPWMEHRRVHDLRSKQMLRVRLRVRRRVKGLEHGRVHALLEADAEGEA